jgi:hypothetical protein
LTGSTYLLFIIPQLYCYIPTIRLYAETSGHVPAIVPFPKVNPAGLEGIPDRTYSLGSHAGI